MVEGRKIEMYRVQASCSLAEDVTRPLVFKVPNLATQPAPELRRSNAMSST